MTPLNASRANVLWDVLHIKLMDLPTRTERKLGPDKDQWCHYHRTYGHETENCRILIREIERLVQDGHLGRYVKKATDGTYRITSRGDANLWERMKQTTRPPGVIT